MDSILVRPQKWTLNPNYDIRILFDDDSYTVIWGEFDGIKHLGARWNGGDTIGFPSQGGNPTWHVEPDIIAHIVLNGLLEMSNNGNINTSRENILFAIVELNDKMKNTYQSVYCISALRGSNDNIHKRCV
jgi:hypothetical protein